MKKNQIGNLVTETKNPRTEKLDIMTSAEAVNAIMVEEKRAIQACLAAQEQLAKAVDLYVKTLQGKNRIVVTGSGCSGDYAQTDVLELEATFSQPSDGDPKTDSIFALHTQKGYYFNPDRDDLVDEWCQQIKTRDTSEDSLEQPLKDLDYINFKKNDLLIAITASGRSPSIVALAKEAKKRGGKVISLVMNHNTEIAKYSNITVEAVVGQPPLAGSGRTLAGTASKILITTLSTAAHAQLGGVYKNLMVNLNVKKWLDNSKFINRAIRIVEDITKLNFEDAEVFLKKADWNIKAACVMALKKVNLSEANTLLEKSCGKLRAVLDEKNSV